jgi:hypothetical protein
LWRAPSSTPVSGRNEAGGGTDVNARWTNRGGGTNVNTGWVGRLVRRAVDVDASLEHERRASALGGQVLDVETPW